MKSETLFLFVCFGTTLHRKCRSFPGPLKVAVQPSYRAIRLLSSEGPDAINLIDRRLGF